MSELEQALGIENKRTRNPSPSKDGPRRRYQCLEVLLRAVLFTRILCVSESGRKHPTWLNCKLALTVYDHCLCVCSENIREIQRARSTKI